MRFLGTPRALTALLAVSVLALSGPACTTTEEHTFLVAPDGAVQELVTTDTIGTGGGTISVTNPDDPAFGTELSVPADAVDRSTEISISADADVQGTPFGTRAVGPEISITPLDLAFNTGKQALLTLPFRLDAARGERLVVLRRSAASGVDTRGTGGNATGDWEILFSRGTGDESRRVVVDTDRLGVFVVAVAPESIVLPDGGTDSGVIPLPDSIGSVDGSGGDGPSTGNDQRPPVFAGLFNVDLVEDQGAVSAVLSWDPATDDQSAPEQIRYRLYLPSFATVGQPQGESAPGAESLTVRVARGVTYYFLIRAVDAAGNEDSNLRILSVDVPTGQLGRVLGDTCGQSSECQSNFCVDGVCCENACDGSCSYCANANSEGRCQAAAEGTDPRSECDGGGASGTVMLCGTDQTCSQCQASNGEICNNGKDDNDDGLMDGQDPACVACLGPLVCVSEPARVFDLRNGSQTATSIASDGVAAIALGVQDISTPQTNGALATLQRASLVDGFVGDTIVQTTMDAENTATPVVVRGDGEWVIFFDDIEPQSAQRRISAARVSDAGALVGSVVTVVPETVGELRSFTAVATGDGYRVLYTYFDTSFDGVLDIVELSPTLARGTLINLKPASDLTDFNDLRLADDRAASGVVALWRTSSKGNGTSYEAVRLAYNASTGSPTTLNLGQLSASSVDDVQVAVVGTGATANTLLLAYAFNDGNSNLIIGAQRYDAALAPIGTRTDVNYGLFNSYTTGLSLAAHGGRDAALLWQEVPFKAFYSRLWLTRFDASDASETSTIRLSDIGGGTLNNVDSLAGIAASGLHYGAGLNVATKGTGTSQISLCDGDTRPGNDTCATAFAIAEGETQMGHTGSANDDGPLGTCTTAGRDVYYTLTAQTAVQVNVISAFGSTAAIDVADSCTPTTCSSSDGPQLGGPTGGNAYMFINSSGTYVLRVRVTAGSLGADYVIRVSNAS